MQQHIFCYHRLDSDITGAVDHSTGTRDVKKLGGLLTIMPISFTITVITAA
jgi:multicomponent Na+:H+ antiporter subunit A